jgi:uncharacterized protein
MVSFITLKRMHMATRRIIAGGFGLAFFALSCSREPIGARYEAPIGTRCIGPGPHAAQVQSRNVFGESLAACPSKSSTGFFRNGFCTTGEADRGVHVVCANVTEEFLQFSKEQGNDLLASRGDFPGLKPGDAWCLCAARWKEALEAGRAPPVQLNATEQRALDFVALDALQAHAKK